MMFDLGFTEILFICIVALVVLGPERLPKVANSMGRMLAKLRLFVNHVKSEITQQMQVEEWQDLHDSLKESGRILKDDLHQINQDLGRLSQDNKPWDKLPPQRSLGDFAPDGSLIEAKPTPAHQRPNSDLPATNSRKIRHQKQRPMEQTPRRLRSRSSRRF